MSVDAVVRLHRLRCVGEGDDADGSEPCAWTVLFWFDDTTVTSGRAGVLGPPDGVGACLVIKSGMKPGDEVVMPHPQRRLTHRFDEDAVRVVGTAVALLEADDMPVHIARTGYRAFLDEIARVLGGFVKDARRAPTVDELRDLLGEVARRVIRAVEADMSPLEKAQGLSGFAAAEDVLGAEAHCAAVGRPGTRRDFELRFAERFVLDGSFETIMVE